MVRLISHLLWLVALLLAPLPAAATSSAAATMSASAQHCDEGEASKSSQHDDRSQEDGDRSCCKDMGHCCPAAVPFTAQDAKRHAEISTPTHGPWAEIFMSGSAGPPLTEPPTIA